MPIRWKLRECLSERGITRAAQVSKIVRERTGYVLSTQAVCDLFHQPRMLRLETSQALCDAFYCRLSDFFEVVPRATVRTSGKVARARERQPSKGDSVVRRQQSQNRCGSNEDATPETSKVDFAAFFPDAREISS